MSLVFASICPHPPILIPGVGKENLKKLEKTQKALLELEKKLYVSKPDSIIVISPHGKTLDDAFGINLSPDYIAKFEEFGDFSTQLKFKSDYMFIQEMRAADETKNKVSTVLVSQLEIDHGISIPLYYLTQHLKDVGIIPINYSNLNFQAHFDFGKFLYEQINKSNKRIAVIASGDLSHRLTKEAPAGFSEKGKIFDKKIIELIKKKKIKKILDLDPGLIQEAGECGLRSIIILLGALNELDYQPEILSYEGPFGVGYLVVHFQLK